MKTDIFEIGLIILLFVSLIAISHVVRKAGNAWDHLGPVIAGTHLKAKERNQ